MRSPATLALDKLKVPYELLSFHASDFTAAEAAQALDLSPCQVYKTLLLAADDGTHFLCVVPGDRDLSVRKAAKAAGRKKAAMAPLSDLQRITGYVKGGCSPVGTKRRLAVFLDASAKDCDRISVSAGQRGWQLWIAPDVLRRACSGSWADLAAD